MLAAGLDVRTCMCRQRPLGRDYLVSGFRRLESSGCGSKTTTRETELVPTPEAKRTPKKNRMVLVYSKRTSLRARRFHVAQAAVWSIEQTHGVLQLSVSRQVCKPSTCGFHVSSLFVETGPRSVTQQTDSWDMKGGSCAESRGCPPPVISAVLKQSMRPERKSRGSSQAPWRFLWPGCNLQHSIPLVHSSGWTKSMSKELHDAGSKEFGLVLEMVREVHLWSSGSSLSDVWVQGLQDQGQWSWGFRLRAYKVCEGTNPPTQPLSSACFRVSYGRDLKRIIVVGSCSWFYSLSCITPLPFVIFLFRTYRGPSLPACPHGAEPGQATLALPPSANWASGLQA